MFSYLSPEKSERTRTQPNKSALGHADYGLSGIFNSAESW